MLGISVALAVGMLGYLGIAGRLEPASRVLTLAGTIGADDRPLARLAGDAVATSTGGSGLGRSGPVPRPSPQLLQIPNAKFLSRCETGLSLRTSTVDGPTGRRLLEGISLEIPAGSKTAIMGRDEDSKQAACLPVASAARPPHGTGSDGRARPARGHARFASGQVATVFQSDLIFSDTVGFNIGLGRCELRPPSDHRSCQEHACTPHYPGPAAGV